jgi:hypothetical protein
MTPYPPSATICAGIRRPNSVHVVRTAHAVRAPCITLSLGSYDAQNGQLHHRMGSCSTRTATKS